MQQFGFPQLHFNQANGQRRGVNGHVHFPHQVGQCANVVLVTVGDEDGLHFIAVFPDVFVVGNDGVNAQHIVLREHNPGVDNENFVFVFNDGHILANFAETA